jgi:hypothetical protein
MSGGRLIIAGERGPRRPWWLPGRFKAANPVLSRQTANPRINSKTLPGIFRSNYQQTSKTAVSLIEKVLSHQTFVVIYETTSELWSVSQNHVYEMLKPPRKLKQ